jgi:hypothetical protein
MIPKNIIEWLINSDDPALKYRTFTELLDKKDIGMSPYKDQIIRSKPVKTILEKMNPNGYWLQKNPRTKEILGDGVVYGAFGTTHYCLSYLAEIGLDKTHPKVAKASDRYLNLQKSDGDFLRHFSCLLGLNIRTFILLGYQEDARVKKSINLLLKMDRPDGGYLCDMHEGRYKTKAVKSCFRGSVKALLAFSYLPQLWEHERCKKLVDYFFSRNVIFKSTDLETYVNKDIERTSFPITWRANVFEILLSLSKMGYGGDRRLQRAWEVLDNNKDSKGRYILNWTPSQCPWKVGKRNRPNRWLTFYSYLTHKYINSNSL